MDDQLMTSEELSRYLRIPKTTLYYLVQEKEIPGFKVGRHWRFNREEIDTWIKNQREAYKRKAGKK